MFKFKSVGGKHIVYRINGWQEHIFDSLHDAFVFIKYN